LKLTGVAIGKEFSQCRTKLTCFVTAVEAKEYFLANPIENKVVLLKGSRGMKLEQLKDIL
jgi:UDP-N-acetylmuramyl pentapeptide synthase